MASPKSSLARSMTRTRMYTHRAIHRGGRQCCFYASPRNTLVVVLVKPILIKRFRAHTRFVCFRVCTRLKLYIHRRASTVSQQNTEGRHFSLNPNANNAFRRISHRGWADINNLFKCAMLLKQKSTPTENKCHNSWRCSQKLHCSQTDIPHHNVYAYVWDSVST